MSKNIDTELKSKHSELAYFCQAFRSKLIKTIFLVGTQYFISSNAMNYTCACKPLIVYRNIAPLFSVLDTYANGNY